MLVRLLYASRPAEPVGSALIEFVLDQCRRNNPAQGITGLLCFTSGLFIQVLEGGRSEVSSLFSKIGGDPRHRDVTILLFEEIEERHFTNWSMGQVDLSKVNSGLLLRFFERPELDPFNRSGTATMRLIGELVSNGAIVNRCH